MGQPVSVGPLVVFRIFFGLAMLFSTTRYVYLGWVDSQLAKPIMHFHYYGFSWVEPLPRLGLYLVFGLLLVASISIILGAFYRIGSILFFVLFTYIELIDLTYYLNHYYFVSIVSFLLIWVPANARLSIDVWRKPRLYRREVPRWAVSIFKLQIAIVYIYAGLAKINYDWLINALPLAIWLPAKTSIPVIGPIFKFKLTAYIFSWAGMLFDTFIILFLSIKRTRWLAYIAVVIFHSLTGILFQIGVFPLVMILAVTLFFSDDFHEKIIAGIHRICNIQRAVHPSTQRPLESNRVRPIIVFCLLVFFGFQILFPWRYLWYPGNIFWTEEGYRFSWRVMLMEKAGTATFFIKDGKDGREGSVINSQFLNQHQEKQMAMQPDMILQFAHFLEDYYMEQGMKDPMVRAEVWVTLNARPAQLLVDPTVDLTKESDTFKPKKWITPYHEAN